MTLTRNDLDETACGSPDCKHDHTVLYFNPRCHPEAALFVCYDKPSGNLRIECAECEHMVAEIAVAGDTTQKIILRS
jgi:hypothetical protein